MELSEDNIKRLTNWVEKESRIQDPSFIIQPSQIYSFDSDTIQRCPSCLEIPRFPIIFPCGHLECHNCYIKDFKVRGRHRENTYFSNCPNCRAEVNPEQVRTAREEIKLNPSSKAAKFYSTLQVQCDNINCNQFYPYSDLTKHEIFTCPYREVECPAKACPCAGTPDRLLVHTINCPLHFIWCKECYSKWPVAGYVHSCIKALQARFLSDKTCIRGVHHLSELHKLPSGSVVLPDQSFFEYPDDAALLSIRNLVRLDRGLVLFGHASRIPEAPPVVPLLRQFAYQPRDEQVQPHAAQPQAAQPQAAQLQLEHVMIDSDDEFQLLTNLDEKNNEES